jgi:hypothetical protein
MFSVALVFRIVIIVELVYIHNWIVVFIVYFL